MPATVQRPLATGKGPPGVAVAALAGFCYPLGMSRILVIAWVFVAAAAACGEPDRGPEGVAREVFALLAANPMAAGLERAYEHLSDATRASLEGRAAAFNAASSGAAKVQPWDLLAFERFAGGDRVAAVTVEEVTDTEARVTVKFSWLVAATAGGRQQQPEPVTVRMLRQDGKWRVDLPLDAPR
jgi:hypothetical protein